MLRATSLLFERGEASIVRAGSSVETIRAIHVRSTVGRTAAYTPYYTAAYPPLVLWRTPYTAAYSPIALSHVS